MQRIKASNLNRGLIGAWCPSVSGSGLLLPDLSGYGNHGTLTNMDANDWVGTDRGRALDFDGVNDSVATSFKMPATSDFTFSSWFKTSQNSEGPIFSNNNQQLGRCDFKATSLLSGTYRAFLFIAGSPNLLLYGTSTTNTAEWRYLVVNRFNNNFTLYVNGIAESTATSTNSINSANFILGGSVSGLQDFAGQLNDIRIYNRALSPSKIKQLYEGGPGYGLRPERKRTRFASQAFNAGRYRTQQLIGSGVY